MSQTTSLQKNYNLKDEREIKDFFGAFFTRKSNGQIMLIQPHLIDKTIAILELDKDTIKKMNDTSDRLDQLLYHDSNIEPRIQTYNYQSAVGYLSYMHAMDRPDIMYEV